MRVLLTGASRGIGRAIAARLAGPGAFLALCASSPSAELDAIVATCAERGARVEPLIGDLADPAVPARLVGTATDRLGGLDAVVSNAGVVAPGRLCDLDEEAWDRTFAINVRSAWLLARAAHPHLRAARGSLVAIASMSGVEPYPGTGAYSPSKAALIMLVRSLAQEWAADGVRVNAVSPGLFRTAMTAPIYADPQKTAAREALVPMGRIGDPEQDCAGLVAFLLSPDAGYLTGQNLLVDGGLLGSIQSHLAGRPKSG
ncbi:MAG: SDR family NAD(P)-dependent oxidoreductase [Hyphomicrobiaceae bacterium]|nr:MAG: beta-ketoacyl-ACP reductase [Alphaproteobacteria bacterium]